MAELDDENDDCRLDEVLSEYMLRVDRGEVVDREQFIAEYPDVGDRLRAFFADGWPAPARAALYASGLWSSMKSWVLPARQRGGTSARKRPSSISCHESRRCVSIGTRETGG